MYIAEIQHSIKEKAEVFGVIFIRRLLFTVYFITVICSFPVAGRSQNLPIGHLSTTYFDPARGNRPLPSEIYYPGLSAGENTPVAGAVCVNCLQNLRYVGVENILNFYWCACQSK
jgi:hypothetical protein